MDSDGLAALLMMTRNGIPPVAAEFSRRIDLRRLHAAHDSWAREQPRGSVAELTSSGPGPESHDNISINPSRIWYSDPETWRYEMGPAGASTNRVIVVNGDRWMEYQRSLGLRSGTGDPPLWPLHELLGGAELAELFDFSAEGTTTQAGRRALRAKGVPRPPTDEHPESDLPWRGADYYTLLVDEETGIVLRLAGIFEGEEFASKEITEVEFGAAIPPELLVIDVPAKPPSPWRRFLRRVAGRG